MKTLLVEDDEAKRGAIRAVLFAVTGFDRDGLVEVSTSIDARRALQATYFDLLILDISLPRRPGHDPDPNEGVLLLEEIVTYPDALQTPSHIVGITAYPDIYSRAADIFSSRLLTLIQYEPASVAWSVSLQARVQNILSALGARENEEGKYQSDLGIVCALDSPELQSVFALPWNWSQLTVPGDHTIYWHGSFRDVHGNSRSAYAAAVGRMGMPTASVISMKIIQAFRPKYLVMTGMAAGIRGKVNIGDVIVADPSWDWGSGKWAAEGEGRRFLAAPHQLRLAVAIRDKMRVLSRDSATLGRIRENWPGEKPDSMIAIRIGPLASGSSVLADSRTAEEILEQHRQLLGIDMEAYGVMAAAEECGDPRPMAVALKSVVDFADADKNDKFQSYACFMSAQVLRYLVEAYSLY